MMNEYYKILGLNENASLLEIKKAYKKLAFVWHPDRNKSPLANEKFIEINNAFESLIKYKSTGFLSDVSREDIYRKAQEYAQMRYQEYINSDEYKEQLVFNNVMDLITYFWVIILSFFPFFLFLAAGVGFVIFYLIIYIIGISLFFYKFPIKDQIKRSDLISYLKKVFSPKKSFVYISSIFNLYCFFFIGFRTLIPLMVLMLGYILSSIFSYYLIKKAKPNVKKNKQLMITFIYTPLFISSLLFLNYFVPISKTTEKTYNVLDYSNNLTVSYSLDELNYYSGARFFFDNFKLKYADRVRYTFQTGLLGIEVIKKKNIMLKKGSEQDYEENRPKFKY